MSGKIEEQLSAFLDGELDARELELLLHQMDRSPDHRATMARYSLAGDGVRQDELIPAALGLGERVREAIRTETAYSGRGPLLRHWSTAKQGLVGTGIAATVAVVALLGLGEVNQDSQLSDLSAAVSPASGSSTQENNFSYIVPVSATSSQTVIAPARLTGYLVSHGEYSSLLSRQSIDSHIVNQIVDRREISREKEQEVSPPDSRARAPRRDTMNE